MSDKTEHPILPAAFAELGIRNSVLKGLAEARFVEPSDIQRLLIPRALAGVDILGQARTGTGKTAAFAIPLLCRAERGLPTQAIILVPTRELAVQVHAEIERLAVHTPLRCVAVYGGQRITAQLKLLKHGPEILVGTPGRVIDLLERRLISFGNIRFVVLDEVDRMLDIGFRDDIRRILSIVKQQRDSSRDSSSSDGQSRPGVQTIFVSATIAGEIERLARTFMREPVEKLVAPGADEKPTVEKVRQSYFSVQPWDKYRLLRMLLEREKPELAIVFCRTKHGAEKLAKNLHADGIECREIHGNLRQTKRDKVMKSFRGGKFDVLVATDLASRGIDVADISHIINYDIPEDPEVYVHRVGRTARMGAEGRAFLFVTPDQGNELTRIEALINMVIPLETLEGFEPSPPRHGYSAPTPKGMMDSVQTLQPVSTPVAPPAPSKPLRLGSKIRRRRRR
jgi:ATP-dependent RNA helicase DeaD